MRIPPHTLPRPGANARLNPSRGQIPAVLDRPTYTYISSHIISSVNHEFLCYYSFWPKVEPFAALAPRPQRAGASAISIAGQATGSPPTTAKANKVLNCTRLAYQLLERRSTLRWSLSLARFRLQSLSAAVPADIAQFPQRTFSHPAQSTIVHERNSSILRIQKYPPPS